MTQSSPAGTAINCTVRIGRGQAASGIIQTMPIVITATTIRGVNGPLPAATAGLQAKQKRVGSVAFVVRGRGEVAELAQAASEGLTLSEFYSGAYKTSLTGDQPPAPAPAWTVVVEGGGDVVERAGRAVARGRILGESCNLARELANEPGNTLTPREFAKRAAAIAADAGV